MEVLAVLIQKLCSDSKLAYSGDGFFRPIERDFNQVEMRRL